MNKSNFYSVLFDDGEHTNFVPYIQDKATGAVPVSGVRAPFQRFFSINPLKEGKTRADANVKVYRNFLFEMDKVDKEKQIEIFKEAKMPFSTVVYSGGKSFHFILSLETPFTERVQYDAMWKACAAVLAKFGGVADPQCKNPSRFSRMPGVLRDNGVEQTLKGVAKRWSKADVFTWLESNGVNWETFIPKITPHDNAQFSTVENKLKLNWILTTKMANMSYEQGGRNHYQYVLARGLKNTGVDKITTIDLIRGHCGEIIDNCQPIDSAFSPSNDNDEKIYVPTLKERRDYFKAQEIKEGRDIAEQHKAAIKQIKMDAYNPEKRPPIIPEIEVEPGEGLHRFITVGTDYFKIDVEENKLIPWNASMFEKIYGKGIMPPKAYDDFAYNPDYISPLHEVIDCGSLRQYRNYFHKPFWNVKSNSWPTIETALRGAFKSQYDLVLKYAAVSILYPKQPLPIIVYVGEENVGKSGVIKIFQMLLGEKNCKTIKSKQFESDFEGHLQYIQLLIIEEAGNWKDPTAVAAEFKRLATETGKIWVNPKFGRQIEVPFYGKFMLTSNDLSPVKLEGAATRFWVIEMEKIETEITNYLEKIQDEIGAFAQYLKDVIGPTLENPKTKTQRMYFDPEEYWTPAKDFMKDFSKSDLHFEIEEIFNEFFTSYDHEDVCWFDLASLKIKLKGDAKDKAIKAILKKEWKIDSRTTQILKPDSLKFTHESANFLFDSPIIPERKARWFCLEKSKMGKN